MSEEEKEVKKRKVKPGVCVPWEERVKEYEKIIGDKKIVRKAWEELDKLAYLYIWYWLLA